MRSTLNVSAVKADISGDTMPACAQTGRIREKFAFGNVVQGMWKSLKKPIHAKR